MRAGFGLEKVVLVGDRGLLTQARLNHLRRYEGIGWISALRSTAIRGSVEQKHLQRSLFEKKNLAEIYAPDYPGERLVACFSPILAEERKRKREEQLTATENELERVQRQLRRQTPLSGQEIALKVGKFINKYRLGKHFRIRIEDGVLSWSRDREKIEQESGLDGIHIIRTSEPEESLSAEDTVRESKSLAQVERAFRCMKGLDLRIRPIHHHKEKTVRAHIFLCLLAYYVEWHLRRALAPLLFEDEQLPRGRLHSDPVTPAGISSQAQKTKLSRTSPEGFELPSFETLFAELATRTLNVYRVKSDESAPTFTHITKPTDSQQRVSQFLGLSQ